MKSPEQILSEVSGLEIETIKENYKWAIKAMQEFAEQEREKSFGKPLICHL